MRKKRVIFLDIDGVMNSQRYYTECTPEQVSVYHDKYGVGFDPVSERLLNALIEETWAEVIISSTWRLSGLNVMREMWRDRRMFGEMAGVTPNFDIKPIEANMSAPRGCEIAWYIDKNYGFQHRTYDAPFLKETHDKCELFSYVIIDDDFDMLYCQRNNFVKCDPMVGFTEREYALAKKILMTPLMREENPLCE